jgi:hypothetical protein
MNQGAALDKLRATFSAREREGWPMGSAPKKKRRRASRAPLQVRNTRRNGTRCGVWEET